MIGLVVGRFQPLHKGHEALITFALAHCDRVTVAVGSSQEGDTFRDPFTYEERCAMLEAVFADKVRVVPVPDIHDPPNWVAHLHHITGDFDVVFGNDDATLGLFEEAGHRVERPGLVDRERFQAATLRRRMASGDPDWKGAVPAPVVLLLQKWQAPTRLRALEEST